MAAGVVASASLFSFALFGVLDGTGDFAVFAGVEDPAAFTSFGEAVAGTFAGTGSDFAGAGLFAAADSAFAAGWLAGTLGLIDAILSFSIRTNPKSVFTLNMLSS